MTLPRPLVLASTLERLASQRFTRNRAELARAAGITPSALSQYIRGRSLPSVEVLVRLAATLEVSLDYLVLGEEALPPTVAEFGGVIARLGGALRDAQARSAVLYELVARIGARVERQIRDVAEDLVPEAAFLGGALSPDEVARLERFSHMTRSTTTTLDEDVVVVRLAQMGDIAAPGVIGQTVIENLRSGKRYEYVVPDNDEQERKARVLVELMHRQVPGSALTDGEQLQVVLSPRPCVPGFVVHELDVGELEVHEREIYDRVAPFLHFDRGRTSVGHLGAVEPPSRSMRNFVLIASTDVPSLLREHAWLKSSGRRLDPANWTDPADGTSTRRGSY